MGTIINLPINPATARAEDISTTLATASNVLDTFNTAGRLVSSTGTFPSAATSYEVGDSITATYSNTALDGFGAFTGDFVLLQAHTTAAGGGTLLFSALAQETGFVEDNPIFGTTENVTLTIRQIITPKTGAVPGSISIANRTALGLTSLAASNFSENNIININSTNLVAADIDTVGQEVRITTTPSQFVGDAVVETIDTTAGTVSLRIEDVSTARVATHITALSLALINRAGITPVTTTVTSGGFAHAIYNGNDVSSNVHERGLTVTFGSAGETTSLNIRPGTPLPTGATITNTNLEEFNLLINQ